MKRADCFCIITNLLDTLFLSRKQLQYGWKPKNQYQNLPRTWWLPMKMFGNEYIRKWVHHSIRSTARNRLYNHRNSFVILKLYISCHFHLWMGCQLFLCTNFNGFALIDLILVIPLISWCRRHLISLYNVYVVTRHISHCQIIIQIFFKSHNQTLWSIYEEYV